MLRAALHAWLSRLAASEGSAESRMLNPFLKGQVLGLQQQENAAWDGFGGWLQPGSLWHPCVATCTITAREGGQKNPSSLPQGAAAPWEGEKRALRKGPGLWVSVPRHDPGCCVPTAGAGERENELFF